MHICVHILCTPFGEDIMLSHFQESIREPGAAFISPRRLSDQLEITLSVLSKVLHVHRNTFRNPQSETLQQKLRQIARVVSRAEILLGSQEKAVFWFRNQPLADYGGMTAEEMVSEGHYDAISTYLDDVENGAAG